MNPVAESAQMADRPYDLDDFPLESIRNRQEARVAEALREALAHAGDFCGCRLCVEDVYAMALNGLPPHYVQSGAMLLGRQPPNDDEVARAVQDALAKVRERPNHSQ